MVVDTGSTPVRLRSGAGLEDLEFVADERRPLGPGEVRIAVEYTGLNFTDLAKVMGVLPREAMEGTHTGGTLGIECSGTVTGTGRDVTGLRPGDQVFAVSRDLFSSQVTVDQARVCRKPATLFVPAGRFPVPRADRPRRPGLPGERAAGRAGTGELGCGWGWARGDPPRPEARCGGVRDRGHAAAA